MCSFLTGCSEEKSVESRGIEIYCDKAINSAEDFLNHYKSYSEAYELIVKTYDECKTKTEENENNICYDILSLSMKLTSYSFNRGTTADIKSGIEDLKEICY